MQFQERNLPKLALAIVFILSSGQLFSQDKPATDKDAFDMKSASFYLPSRLPKGSFQHTFWIANFFLPSDWTNNAINAPMFNYTARYTLPAGFSLEGGVATLFISNRFTLGPRWSYSRNNFHVGASYLYGYNLGFLSEFGFSTLITAWSHHPTVSVGYSFPKSSLTLRMGLEYLGNFYYKTGDNVVTSDNFNLNGSFVGLVLEQRLWKDHVLSFGFEMDHMNFVMLAWPAFPVNKKTYFIPQVTLGLVF